MKFKVGDSVRVLDGSCIVNYTATWVKSMNDEVGKIRTIAEVVTCYSSPAYRLKECSYTWDERGLESVCPKKIVITSDGETTLARLYENNKVIKKAEAICSPDDEFDFITGAKLAFERLNSEDKPRGIKKAIRGAFYKVIGNSSPRHHFDIGDIVKCKDVFKNSSSEYCSEKTGIFQYVSNDDVVLISKPEEKPKFFTGKVVCIKSEFPFWTVGKIYDIKDGDIVDDEGDMRHGIKSIKKFNERLDGCEFIEIKD